MIACALALAATLLLAPFSASAQEASPMVGAGANGALIYQANARGDQVIDFSSAGYGGGGVAIPQPAATLVAGPVSGDATAAIQAAIDHVSALPLGANGIRGVVQLEAGAYRLDGRLHIRASGVVLRGSGNGENGTVLTAAGVSRDALIEITGQGAATEIEGSRRAIAAQYTPVGARRLTLESAAGFRVGETIRVHRPSTAVWIALLGMDQFEGWRPENRLHWRPGSRDIVWDRRIVAIEGATIVLDAPITTALDADYGGGFVYRTEFPGRLSNVGVENLRLVSAYDSTRIADEDHAWFAIAMDKVRDGWIRNISARHFVSYVVNLGPDASRITVQDIDAAAPISEIGGFRRRVYYAAGQQILFNRCRSDEGGHDFSLGHAAAGPNVFLDCEATNAHDDSGPLESWASGALFDNVAVRGGPLRLANRGRDGQGVGWSAANSVLWNCQATSIEAAHPPGAYNLALGCKGYTAGDGVITDARAERFRDFFRADVMPVRSLYLAQLTERAGPRAASALAPATFAAPPPRTRRLTATQIAAWQSANTPAPNTAPTLRAENGRFLIGDQNAWTRRIGYSWFQAQMPPSLAASFGPAITRFAPGRTGTGLTDDLETVVAAMAPGDVFYQHYGLWYDRRRVDHNYFGSPDERTGEVWGPLMEGPWARSGQGRAWDGLSKYDLTRFNPWYFERVRDFADSADRHGRVLYYNFYFQHWLLESRSHYVDFAWRPRNALQNTGLPDEVPAAETFYDLSDPLRRDLHRRYIRHTLDTLRGARNLVYGVDREYSGPLSFLQFWLDEIAAWEAETGDDVFVALEVPKAQMDAILDDPVRGPRIDAIDFHHWVYRPDGALFTIRGGLNRAPRQQIDDIFLPGEAPADAAERARARDALWASTPAMRYRALREYRDRYPDLVVLLADDAFPSLTASVEALIPRATRTAMRPATLVAAPRETAWASAAPDGALLIYSMEGASVRLDRGRAYRARWVGAGSSAITETTIARGQTTLTPPPALAGAPWAVWLTPN